MALIVEDRVVDTSTTTGLGNYVLAGTVTGFRDIASVVTVGDTFYYSAEEVSILGVPVGGWETGLGTFAVGNELARTTLHSSSTGSFIDWTAGTRRITLGVTSTNFKDKISSSLIGAISGVASLDGSGKVPSAQLPAYVDDGLEYTNLAALPGTGTAGIIYVTLDNNKTYRWSGSAYIEISSQDLTGLAPLSNPTFTTAINLNGTSSGTVTIVATAIAGTPTLTLPTVSGKVNLERTITAYTTGTYTPTDTSGNPVFLCNTTSGNVTVTLPTAIGNTAIYTLKKVTTLNSMIIGTTSSQTIDDSATITVTEQYETLTLVSDNANWKVI